MVQDEETFDALLVSEVLSVRLFEGNQVAVKVVLQDGKDTVLVVLDQAGAVQLSELLLAYGPPALDEEVQFEFSSSAQGEVDVDEVLVDSQGESRQPFQVSFRVGENKPFTMRLSHREVVRWYKRLGAEITGYIKRKAN